MNEKNRMEITLEALADIRQQLSYWYPYASAATPNPLLHRLADLIKNFIGIVSEMAQAIYGEAAGREERRAMNNLFKELYDELIAERDLNEKIAADRSTPYTVSRYYQGLACGVDLAGCRVKKLCELTFDLRDAITTGHEDD